ncbi:MAG: D-2-hydroxyacid dehydrogenase family protein [Anaerolinea sp.]|nr:D-2-hydroxyacid dehydrogenase family protein [Anaerolinea sp.]
MLNIVIPDDYQGTVQGLACFQILQEHSVRVYQDTVRDTASLAARFQSADALVLIRERTTITADLLHQLPRLRLISQTGRGAAHIDLESCTRQGVAVAVGVGSPYAPAELTWALILSALRHIPQEVTQLRAGRWQTTLGTGLQGRTLGIFGYGKIGTLVAQVGRAFGMKVLIWGREGSRKRASADGFEIAHDQLDLFRRADVLSLHLRLNGETEGIVTADHLALMKTDSLLVNTSRAQLIAPAALLTALQRGRPGFAAVDVFEQEPTLNDPLIHMPNVLCTPHLGYVEKDSYELYFEAAFRNLLAFFEGSPQSLLNPEVLQHPRK